MGVVENESVPVTVGAGFGKSLFDFTSVCWSIAGVGEIWEGLKKKAEPETLIDIQMEKAIESYSTPDAVIERITAAYEKLKKDVHQS